MATMQFDHKTTRTSSRQRWTLLLVCTAAFMLLLDITIVSVGVCHRSNGDLGAEPCRDLQWISAAYALVLAVLLLPAATLGDRFWPSPAFAWADLVIFTPRVTGVCAGQDRTVARVVPRVAGSRRSGAICHCDAAVCARRSSQAPPWPVRWVHFGATLGGASAIGPLAGGLLTDTLGWRVHLLSQPAHRCWTVFAARGGPAA